MARKKVTLAFIANTAARKITYAKRKKGLMKKVEELATLCGVQACAIIYTPYDNHAEVWPENNQEALGAVLARFQNLSEARKTWQMLSHDSFLQQRKTKLVEQLKKLQRDNKEKEMTRVMSRNLSKNGTGGHDLEMVDLIDLGSVIDRTLREIGHRINGAVVRTNDDVAAALPNEAVMPNADEVVAALPNEAVVPNADDAVAPLAAAADNPVDDENIGDVNNEFIFPVFEINEDRDKNSNYDFGDLWPGGFFFWGGDEN